MEVYKNTHSGVSAYEFGKDYIITCFGNQYYLYSNEVTGTKNLKRMKELAVIGKGLSSFISRNIRKNYEAMFNSEKELRAYLKKRSP
jgi:hypothetical protein